ncbi:hypothetical protein PS15m_006412 [Mucor circinelloides]
MDNNFKLVTLNVGGKLFTTYYDTLKRSSYFQELIQNKKGEQAIAIKSDAQEESFFIDRDGDIFEAIMHYLRSCDILEKTPERLKKLKSEAAFFKFDEVVMKVDQALYANLYGEDDEKKFEVKSLKSAVNEISDTTLGNLQLKEDQKVLWKYSYNAQNTGQTSKMIVEKKISSVSSSSS